MQLKQKMVPGALMCLCLVFILAGPVPAAVFEYDIDDVTLEPQQILSLTLTWNDFGLPEGQVITGDPKIYLDYALAQGQGPGIIMWTVDSESSWFQINPGENRVNLPFVAQDFNDDRELFTHTSSFNSEWTVKSFGIEAEVVPIPSTLLLLGSGVFGLALWRRRRS